MPQTAGNDSHQPLRSISFVSLLAVQFLTALNDHTFRWLVVPLAKHILGDDALALALGLIAFTVPFIFFSSPAGFLADRYSKARVISACKFAEILILALGMMAIVAGNSVWLFCIVFFTGTLAALFGPAKLGAIPELVHDSQLSNANGWMGLMNVVPCALGFLLGNSLAGLVQQGGTGPVGWLQLWPAAAVIMTIAIVGWVASLTILRVPAADPSRTFSWNVPKETYAGLKELAANDALIRTAACIAFFWMLASLAQLNLDPYGIYDLGLTQSAIGLLGMCLVIGVAFGSLLAGLWSEHHVELGIVPVGALGMTICSFVLYGTGDVIVDQAPTAAFEVACISLLFLGISAGLFDVPLESYLQFRSDPQRLGVIVGATNFIAFSGILLVAGLFWIMRGVLEWSASAVFLLAGIATIPVLVFIVIGLPGATIRIVAWFVMKTIYRVKVYGRKNVPLTGGALLVPNHVTWVDGILLMITAPRPVRFIAYADYVNHPRLSWLAQIYEVIPIKSEAGPKALVQSLNAAREAIDAGSLVCIFPEGTLTRTGQLQPFHAGFMRIIKGTDIPVIPVYMHGLWGSIFSFSEKVFFWKWPRRLPYPISIYFGKPMIRPGSVDEVQRAVLEMGVDAVMNNKSSHLLPPRRFLQGCRSRLRTTKVADSTGTELSGGKLLASTLALRHMLIRRYFARDEQYVGIYLPPSVGGVLANTAVTLSHRVAVNLNYTLADNEIRYCIKEAGLKHVLTSRKMLEKKPLDLPAGVEWVFLEDAKEQITGTERIFAGFQAFAWPTWLLDRWLGLHRINPDEIMTVIFTSGSTGEPKGVMLSYHNVGSNLEAVDQLFQFNEHDTLLGVLPLFHSFGYTVALWLCVCLKLRSVYHSNPLDAREIGKLSEQYGTTILLSTATFLRSYIKRCEKEQFAKLNLVIVGAEKLPLDLAEQFKEKFGVMPTEGYGATETSPVASVNIPDHRCNMVQQIGTKLGSVGRPLPGVAAKAVDPETFADLPTGQEGLLFIKGPNIMQGYLHQPEKTAAVIRDGWYNTGDMGKIDSDGFVFITGRQSRFSKIGGEMVPHIRIEEHLARIVENTGGDCTGQLIAVTAVPDEKKGERLVVLHRPLSMTPAQIVSELAACELPNLWLPSADSFVEVPEIPILGTGKADLKSIKQVALAKFGKA